MNLLELQRVLGKKWVWDGYTHHFRKPEGSNNYMIFVAPHLVDGKLGLKFCKQCICCSNITTVSIVEITTIEEFQKLLSMLKEFE